MPRNKLLNAKKPKKSLSWNLGGKKKVIMGLWASLIAQLVKNLLVLQETWVRFLGLEDPLEKEMATHSSILAWRIPWTEELGRL